jgi:hypothetical protein
MKYLFVLILVGCNDNSGIERYQKYLNRVCSEEQMKGLQTELKVCSETGYFSEDCWTIAKVNHCSKVDSTKP